MEVILDLLGTIKRLEQRLHVEADPREQCDLLETLRMLELSLRHEVERFTKSYRQELAERKRAA